jgi:hypothetical protein
MKTGKYSWLKKNPIVLFFKRLYRLFFKPKQSFVRFNPEPYPITADQNIVEAAAESEDYDGDELVTIGQLFEQVNWHNYSVAIPEKSPKAKRVARAISTDQDQGGFATVGELFQQVKWRVPAKVIQEQFLTTSKKPQAYDVSLN